MLLARKRSNKGFVDKKKVDDDDHQVLAKFDRNRAVEKAANEERQKQRTYCSGLSEIREIAWL